MVGRREIKARTFESLSACLQMPKKKQTEKQIKRKEFHKQTFCIIHIAKSFILQTLYEKSSFFMQINMH